MNKLGAWILAVAAGVAIAVGDAFGAAAPALREVVAKAFAEAGDVAVERDEGSTTSIRLSAGEGGASERIAVKQELEMELPGGKRAVAYSVIMTDRLEGMRQALDAQQFGEHAETAYLLLAVVAPDGAMDVHRLCGAASNEVSGVYGDFEALEILGPGRKQLGVSYMACFQDEEAMGMRQTRFIYDLPSGREIFRAMIGEAFTGASEQGVRWRLQYQPSPGGGAMEICRKGGNDGADEIFTFNGEAYVLGHPKAPALEMPKSLRELSAYYARQAEWKGVPLPEDELPIVDMASMEKPVCDEMTDEEMTKIIKAGFPGARRVDIVGRMMEPGRWGDTNYWTGEVEFRVKHADSRESICYLVWPARVALPNGSSVLSGLILPNRQDRLRYDKAYAERVEKGETIEGIFACVGIDSQGNETLYRDVVASGARGIKDAYGARPDIRVMAGLGIFRIQMTHVMKPGVLPEDEAAKPLKEIWCHIYELSCPRLVFRAPLGAASGDRSLFKIGSELKWRDEDGDGVAELLLHNDKWQGYTYKWEQGTYVFWKRGAIPPDPPPYEPKGLNPPIQTTIVVQDEEGMPLAGCKVDVEITTKHQSVLNLYAEDRAQYSEQKLTTDARGRALLKCKAFTVMLDVNHPGYVPQQIKLKPYAEPVPETVTFTLVKAPPENEP